MKFLGRIKRTFGVVFVTGWRLFETFDNMSHPATEVNVILSYVVSTNY